MKIEGLISAPFTPMNTNGSINLEIIPQYYQFLKKNGVTGAFINGSTGEGVSLTLDEKKKIAEVWAASAKDDKEFKTITLVGGTCIADAQELAKHAQATRLDAIAFTAPPYFKPNNAKALAECCSEIAKTVPDRAFYFYHILVLTGNSVTMFDLLKEIDDKIPNFVGN